VHGSSPYQWPEYLRYLWRQTLKERRREKKDKDFIDDYLSFEDRGDHVVSEDNQPYPVSNRNYRQMENNLGLEDTLMELGKTQVQALLLWASGYSHREVAELTGISRTTQWTIISHGGKYSTWGL
jgi:DNA-directed RNA polymerase specialized sigma24 family protein